MKTYKGCKITSYQGGFIWDEIHYGAESDDVFTTIEAAKANIDLYFGSDVAPREVDGEIYA